jgi:hypothetical protein
MKRHCLLALFLAVALCAGVAHADGTNSYTGTLANPNTTSLSSGLSHLGMLPAEDRRSLSSFPRRFRLPI